MTKKKVPPQAKAERKRHSPEFKQQTLLRREGLRDDSAHALGLEPALLYAWRAKAQQQGLDAETRQLQQSEMVRLKRELARLEEENAFLKKRRHTSRSSRS